jgi:DNA-nicking Smr family endonuclease
VKTRRTPAVAETPAEQPRAKSPTRRVPAPPPPKPAKAAPPQDRAGEKRVRRGRLEIGGTLDLHGHNQDTGRAALTRFLQAAQRRGARTVIVITGVGRGGEGVLRRRLPEWLAASDLRPLVSGYAQAHRAHGGEGAYYVFLRRPRTT